MSNIAMKASDDIQVSWGDLMASIYVEGELIEAGG